MTRAKWDKRVGTEFDGLARPAVEALSTVAGDLPGWQYAAIHALVADLAFEAARARTQVQLGAQPAK